MNKKIAFAAATVVLVVSPLIAFATSDVSIADLNNSISMCLTPAPGTPPAQIQSACANLVQALTAIILRITTNPPTPQICPVYQQMACQPGQHLVSDPTTYDQNNCPVPHSHCVSDYVATSTPNYQLGFSFVSGNQSSYSPGQSVHLVMKGVELYDGSAGTPDEGLNVQVYVNDSNGYGNYVAMNASYNSSTGYWEANFNAPTDTSKTYNLRASFYCSNSTMVCASRYGSGQASLNGQVDLSYSFSLGNSSPSGALTVSLDPSTPSYQLFPAGSTGVTAVVFKFRATGESINLNKIGLLIGPSASGNDIITAHLYDGATQIGTATFIGNSSAAISALTYPITIPRDTDKAITVKIDIASIGISQPATPGDLIVIVPSASYGTGVNSGSTINASAAGSMSVPGIRIFKSTPIVGLMNNTSSIVGNIGAPAALIRFTITASGNGPVSIGTTNFRVNATPGVAFSDVSLYAYTDAGFSSPIPVFGTLGGKIFSCTGAGCPGSSFTTGGGSASLMIPAGQTYYFQLMGTPSALPNSPGLSVTTTLLSDSSPQALSPYSSVAGASFLWSPNDYGTSQGNVSDWVNGYGVAGLPASGLSQTITGVGIPTPPPPKNLAPTCTASISPSTMTFGQGTAVVSWSTQNATNISLTLPTEKGSVGTVIGGLPVSGTQVVTPNLVGTLPYVINMTGPGGSGSCTATQIVNSPPSPAVTMDIRANGAVSSTNVAYGQSATISWTSSGMSSCGIAPSGPSPWAGNFGLNGSKDSGPLTQTITYYLQCNPLAGGNFQQTSVTVNVGSQTAPPTPYASITTDKPVYAPGAPISVSWSTNGTLPKDWVGIVNYNAPWSSLFGGQDVGWFWVSGVLGTKTLTAPTTPGSYQVAYYSSTQGTTADSRDIARSTFNVQALTTPPSSTGTCTYNRYATGGIYLNGVTINIEGGPGACSSWCISQGLEEVLSNYSCSYNGSLISGVGKVSGAADKNANLASALTALEAVLQQIQSLLH